MHSCIHICMYAWVYVLCALHISLPMNEAFVIFSCLGGPRYDGYGGGGGPSRDYDSKFLGR